jgi:ABC-type transport system substrate-binding protein
VLATEFNPIGVEDRCGRKTLKFDYNIEKAKALLAKAGYPGGKDLPTINFDMRGANTANRQIGEFIAKELAQIGIKLNVILNTFPAFLDKRQKKNLQMAYGGWQMDYPDAENMMQQLYGSNAAPGPNEASYRNDAYDKLFDRMYGMSSGAARKNIVCQMEELIQEDTPIIHGFYESLYRLVAPGIVNYRTYEMAQNKYKYIDVK